MLPRTTLWPVCTNYFYLNQLLLGLLVPPLCCHVPSCLVGSRPVCVGLRGQLPLPTWPRLAIGVCSWDGIHSSVVTYQVTPNSVGSPHEPKFLPALIQCPPTSFQWFWFHYGLICGQSISLETLVLPFWLPEIGQRFHIIFQSITPNHSHIYSIKISCQKLRSGPSEEWTLWRGHGHRSSRGWLISELSHPPSPPSNPLGCTLWPILPQKRL